MKIRGVKEMNKKGLSDVVTTVAIILVALVAVGVISTFILNLVNKTVKNADNLQACQDIQLDLKIKSCTKTGNTASVVLERGESANVKLSSNSKIYYKNSAATAYAASSPVTLGSINNVLSTSTTVLSSGSTTIDSIRLQPIVNVDGKDYNCPLYSEFTCT